MLRKAISLLLCAMVLLTALIGCSSGNDTGKGTEEQTAPAEGPTAGNAGTEAEKEVIEVTTILQVNPEIILEDNPVLKKIEEDTGVRLIVEAPPLNDFGDRVKVLVSTGDMPDFFIYGADVAAKQWAQEGLLADLTDRIKDYPNLVSNISKEQYGDTMLLEDGRIYGIPRPNSYDKWGFMINKKWLDKVGKDVPATVDEFIDVCRAFTNGDPDGNNQNDTYGVSFGAQQNSMDSGIWHLYNDFLSTAYGISSWHHGLPDVDGSFKLRALKSKYLDYLTLLRQLYNEGIIDREFITHKSSENVEKFAQNRVGMVGASEKNYTTEIIEKYSLNPDDYVYAPPLTLDKNSKPVYAMPPSNWMAFFINANSDKIDAALKVLDWGNSEEGFVTMQLGIAGVHYNKYDIETRTVERTKEQAEAVAKVTSNMMSFANAYNGKEALMGGSTPEIIAKWQKESAAADAVTQKVYTPFVKIIDKIAVDYPDETQTLNNLEVRYVTGEIQLDELKKFIDETWRVKTEAIAKEFADYMAKNPVRIEN